MFKNLKYLRLVAISLFVITLLYACKRDYIVGGQVHDVNMYKNLATYDVLKKFNEFDTLIQLIDAGNLKDAINQENSTFFAVTDLDVLSYLNNRTIYLQKSVDENKKFLLDSLLFYVQTNKGNTRDSFLMYLLPDVRIAPNNVNNIGTIYSSALTGSKAIVSFEESFEENDGNNPVTSTAPQILYFTQLWKDYQIGTDSTAADVPTRTGVRNKIKTSFLNTKNGVINVPDTSTLFYYGIRGN